MNLLLAYQNYDFGLKLNEKLFKIKIGHENC